MINIAMVHDLCYMKAGAWHMMCGAWGVLCDAWCMMRETKFRQGGRVLRGKLEGVTISRVWNFEREKN